MAFDRYCSRLFAACTDGSIYEYSLVTSTMESVGRYEGATIGSFYVRVATAPSSVGDFLLSGNGDGGQALVWDVSSPAVSLPYVSLGGHTGEIASVDWNARGDVLATCEDYRIRFWRWNMDRDPARTVVSDPEAHFVDRATPYCAASVTDGLTSGGKVELDIARLRVNARSAVVDHRSKPSFPCSPLVANNKRKLAFRSPIKQLYSPADRGKENRPPSTTDTTSAALLNSPVKKTSRLTPLSPPEMRPVGAFHARYPTWGLPNLVLDSLKEGPSMPPNAMGGRGKTKCLLKDWFVGKPGGVQPKRVQITPKKQAKAKEEPEKRRGVEKRKSARTLIDFFG